MCDCKMERISSPGEGKRGKGRKKKFRKFEPNLDTLTRNSKNPLGIFPDDFFTNPQKYRKPDSGIS